jgi:hypothetical protein
VSTVVYTSLSGPEADPRPAIVTVARFQQLPCATASFRYFFPHFYSDSAAISIRYATATRYPPSLLTVATTLRSSIAVKLSSSLAGAFRTSLPSRCSPPSYPLMVLITNAKRKRATGCALHYYQQFYAGKQGCQSTARVPPEQNRPALIATY